MSHTQLTQDERYPIQYLSRHCTVTEIAKQPNRHKSTISRETRRHRTQGRQYSAEQSEFKDLMYGGIQDTRLSVI